ncbi:MAG TPA: hypothetical protein VMU34_26865 [Mycobacterium sp.]|nr:hypothetical protein [Mycobacterium sp.]
MRCTVEPPARNCESPEIQPHVHVVCTRCGAERVVLPEARELAWLASAN